MATTCTVLYVTVNIKEQIYLAAEGVGDGTTGRAQSSVHLCCT